MAARSRHQTSERFGPEDWGNEPVRGDRWVFGYGSLMWNPGFGHEERCAALLHGYHRDMCVLSLRYRGTPERPGLVLGLRSHGSCRGVLYRVRAVDWPEVRAYLHDRELTTYAYIPRCLTAVREDGTGVACHTFVADPSHGQYAGHLDRAERVRLIRQGEGPRGTSRDYLASTVAHLDDLGVRDGHLHDLLDQVDGRCRVPPPATGPG